MDPRIRIRIHPKMSWVRNTAYYFLKLHLHHFSKIKSKKESQNSRNQGFSYYMMIEGCGSGSIPLTNGSGSGSGRSKNMWIRIPATLIFRRRRGERAIPEVPGTRLCCGSDTVFSDSELSPTGNFTRQAAGENINFAICYHCSSCCWGDVLFTVTVKKTQILLMKSNKFRKLCSALFIF